MNVNFMPLLGFQMTQHLVSLHTLSTAPKFVIVQENKDFLDSPKK